MSFSVLSTKLYIPPARQNAIARPRLTEKLVTGLSQPGRFALLSGPAGFGKTTLLSEFVDRQPLPVAWVSLDKGDNDPIRFWSYLIAACQRLQTGLGATAQAMMQSPQPVPADAIPTTLINDLVNMENELVLILDDYHVVEDQSLHEAFVFMLERLPPNLHIVVSTRIDPPWPLARFRARNQIVEIRAQDLRFSIDEAAEFLNRTMGINLSAQEVAALEARTEGWIAGLQLAALSLQGRSNTADFVKAFTGSHVYVAEYLMEEVLQRQPEDVQTFLLKTSILERLNAGLCETITGRQDGQDLLNALHRANLFVISLDDEGRWFRYHQLFADLLQARLRHTLTEDQIASFHQAAAAWYEQNGFIVEAVSHLLSAKDFEEAARLIGQNANPVVTRGGLVTLMRWTEALPEDVIWHHPQIIIAKIWALTLAGDVRNTEPLLQKAEAQFNADHTNPTKRELAGFASAIRAFFAMMGGDDPRALELAERAEVLLPEHSVHARWLLPYTTGAAHRGQGHYEEAVEAFAQQARMGEAYDNLVVWGTGVTGIALVRHAQGRLHEASQVCLQGLRKLAERGAAEFGSLAKLEVPLVEVLCEQNKLDEAQQRLVDVFARMSNWPMPTDQLHAQLALIELQVAQGNLPGAFETLRTAKDMIAKHPVIINLRRSVDLWDISLSLKIGDLTRAEHLLDALNPGESPWVELRDQGQLLFSRLRFAQGRLDEADSLLSSLAGHPETGERKGTLIKSLTLRACVLYAQGDGESALGVLIKALSVAEPEGYARVFLNEGPVIHGLLVEAAHHVREASDHTGLPSDAYLSKLLDSYPPETTTGVTRQSSNQVAGLVEQLSTRELEVLQLIAVGESNRTIAEKLVITVSAVKKHTANIYGKLNVNSRTQAVARARQLGLLPADDYTRRH